jgi:hypothetical protein
MILYRRVRPLSESSIGQIGSFYREIDSVPQLSQGEGEIKPTGKYSGPKFTITEPRFLDADVAREYLEAKRWPDGAVCPHRGVIGEATKLEMQAAPRRPTPVRVSGSAKPAKSNWRIVSVTQ